MIKVGQRWWAWLTSTAARVWEVKHVERRGQYSVAQLLALHHFSTATSLTRSLFIAILSPLPCLALITFFDLKKLSPPYLGLLHDYILLPRATATCFIITLCLLQQLCTQVGPILPISTARLVALAAIIALANASIVMIFSLTVGFPVPFTFQSATPTEWILQVGGLWLSWRHLARANSQAWARILGAAKFYLCQGFLLAVYPLYYHLFTLVPDSSHVLRLFVWCMLPLFNVVARVLFHRFSRKEHGGQELTPLLIVFNADAMGALFITFCVQYNPSLNVSIGVAAYKIIEAGLVYWELRGAGRELGLLQRRLDGPEYSNLVPSNLSASRTRSSSMAVLNDAIQIISSYNLQQQAEGAIISSLSSVARLKSWCIPFGSSVLPVVSDCNKVQSSAELRSIDMEFLDHALQLLYRTELVLLTEYVEVVVPLLYSLYLIAMSHLPNHVYYAQFANMDSESLSRTLTTVLVYTGLEVASLLLVSLHMRRLLGISPFKQLAFVLSRHAVHVQSALVIWVMFSTQASLAHYGTDYSFQFSWLRNSTSPSE